MGYKKASNPKGFGAFVRFMIAPCHPEATPKDGKGLLRLMAANRNTVFVVEILR